MKDLVPTLLRQDNRIIDFIITVLYNEKNKESAGGGMARVAGIGHQDFAYVITNDIFYVDKTAFIKEWWENQDAVTLITRPRRFGKTLNMSMLEYFFSTAYAGRSDLFERFSVWKEERYRKLQGTYPVIGLSFAEVKRRDYPSTVQRINQILTDLYREHAFLLQGDLLSEEEKEEYRQVSMDMPEVIAARALHKLSEYLYRYYGRKIIILLDEYDTPLQEAYGNGYWEELTAFIRDMFNATFKTNPYLERAVMTGITRVSKESIFSDLNHLEVVTTTTQKYEDAFGFTQQEVSEALKEYGLCDREADVKRWYDGFTFGNRTDIYNPWSILNYLDKHRFAAYWANTSSNRLAERLIQKGSPEVKKTMERLLSGKTFCAQIDEQIVFSQLDMTESAIWSFLLAGGYLRVESVSANEWGENIYELALTNHEVRLMFRGMIDRWFTQSTPAYNDFLNALLLGDLEAMNLYMNRVSLATFSCFDTGVQPSESEPERFYHGFVLGLLVDLEGRYTILSNRESGFGRYDIVLEPKKESDDAMILEFKVRNPRRENNLEETVQSALAQIRGKKYAASLEAKGIPSKRIRCYGFAFEGKRVLIGQGV